MMKKYLLGLVGLMVLSGCAGVRMDAYNRGWWNGRDVCDKGKKAAEGSYEKGFRNGYLFENLRGESK